MEHRSARGLPAWAMRASVSEKKCSSNPPNMNFILFVLPISTAQTNSFFSPPPNFMSAEGVDLLRQFGPFLRAEVLLYLSLLFHLLSCEDGQHSSAARQPAAGERKYLYLLQCAQERDTVTILKASTALCCNWCTRRLPGKHLAPRPLNCETPVGTRVAMRCSHAPSHCISPLCRCTSYSWIAMCAQQRCPPLPLQEHACICVRAHSSSILHSSMT